MSEFDDQRIAERLAGPIPGWAGNISADPGGVICLMSSVGAGVDRADADFRVRGADSNFSHSCSPRGKGAEGRKSTWNARVSPGDERREGAPVMIRTTVILVILGSDTNT